MTYQHVLSEVRDRVGIVTLNRPEARNAVNGRLGAELRDALLVHEADADVGAIVLTGAGRTFCSGADVKGWNRALERSDAVSADEPVPGGRAVQPAADQPQESWAQLLSRIKPIVCAYNGEAIGAGLTLTLATDYKIASDRARFAMRFARMGIAPEIESTRLLPALIGLTEALPLMLTGDFVDAPGALAIGLLNEVVPHDDLLDRAIAVAAHFAELHPDVTRTVKRLVHANLFEPDAAQVRHREGAAIAALAQQPSYREAVKAFIEKRQPDFWHSAEDAAR